jgi:hypothetical protein
MRGNVGCKNTFYVCACVRVHAYTAVGECECMQHTHVHVCKYIGNIYLPNTRLFNGKTHQNLKKLLVVHLDVCVCVAVS